MPLHSPAIQNKLVNRIDQLAHRNTFESIGAAKAVGYLWGGWTARVTEVQDRTQFPFWVLRRGPEWAAVMLPTTLWAKQDTRERLETLDLLLTETSVSGTDLVAMCTTLAEMNARPQSLSRRTLERFTAPRAEFPEMTDPAVQTLLALTGISELVAEVRAQEAQRRASWFATRNSA